MKKKKNNGWRNKLEKRKRKMKKRFREGKVNVELIIWRKRNEKFREGRVNVELLIWKKDWMVKKKNKEKGWRNKLEKREWKNYEIFWEKEG